MPRCLVNVKQQAKPVVSQFDLSANDNMEMGGRQRFRSMGFRVSVWFLVVGHSSLGGECGGESTSTDANY